MLSPDQIDLSELFSFYPEKEDPFYPEKEEQTPTDISLPGELDIENIFINFFGSNNSEEKQTENVTSEQEIAQPLTNEQPKGAKKYQEFKKYTVQKVEKQKKTKKDSNQNYFIDERSRKTYLSQQLKSIIRNPKKKTQGVGIKKGDSYKNCEVKFKSEYFPQTKDPKLQIWIREVGNKEYTHCAGSFSPSQDDGKRITFIFDLNLPKKMDGVTNGRAFEMVFRIVDGEIIFYQEPFPYALLGFEMQKFRDYMNNCSCNVFVNGIYFEY